MDGWKLMNIDGWIDYYRPMDRSIERQTDRQIST
jgi:hypothetical protein